jgi:hypothetical protein
MHPKTTDLDKNAHSQVRIHAGTKNSGARRRQPLNVGRIRLPSGTCMMAVRLCLLQGLSPSLSKNKRLASESRLDRTRDRYRRPMRWSTMISKEPRPGVRTKLARRVRVMTGSRKQGGLALLGTSWPQSKISVLGRCEVEHALMQRNFKGTFGVTSIREETELKRG